MIELFNFPLIIGKLILWDLSPPNGGAFMESNFFTYFRGKDKSS